MGRVVNVHCLLVLNTPTEEYLTEEMKLCLSCRASFAVPSAEISRLSLGREGAESLSSPGELMVRSWNDFDRFKTPELGVEREAELIASILRNEA